MVSYYVLLSDIAASIIDMMNTCKTTIVIYLLSIKAYREICYNQKRL
jgi:hypothetical protein